jgi:DNA polymerase III subunit gamma/tau
VSLALYRRYRPETFEEVIGQDHVTRPLQQALRNQRVNHAYLFSGPRGCGKTTSARILARCLNCEQGPTPTPCGVCRSCTDLTRGGPGSIDVIEIDAASHGGVDDARDLRERAFFAPVSSRYKIYILDEAHMVSSAGFNALLKVVEEPPPHLKFIFATTEPEKVIGTIRSRTHHYPFRLVPPGTLRDYLAEICTREQITVDSNVLPLVVRAGAGSVRDAMSVLDQLLAGAGDDGVTYQMAVGLLGYTDAALLDEVVSAFAAGSGGAAFEVIDRVMEGGHDPRRFLADLLERLRDLVILAAVPDAAQKGLISAPGDQVARMQEQAAAFGASELSRAADLVSDGLLEMRGATAPRLLLELVCARVLLPATDDSARGMAARLDRLERGSFVASGFGGDSGGPRLPSPMGAPGPQSAPAPDPALNGGAPAPMPYGSDAAGGSPISGSPDTASPSSADAMPSVAAAANSAGSTAPAAPAPPASGLEPAPWRRAAAAPGSPAAPAGSGAPGGAGSGGQPPPAGLVRPSGALAADPNVMRQAWPQVLDAVARRSKAAWARLSQSAHVVGVEGGTLQLGFFSSGLRDSFSGSKTEELLREALREVSGADWRIDAIVDPSAGSGPGSGGAGPAGGPGGGFGGGAPAGGFGGPAPGGFPAASASSAASAPSIGPPPIGPGSAGQPQASGAFQTPPQGGLPASAAQASQTAPVLAYAGVAPSAAAPAPPAAFSASPASSGSFPSGTAQAAPAVGPGAAASLPASPSGPGSGSRPSGSHLPEPPPGPDDYPPPPEDDYGSGYPGSGYPGGYNSSASRGVSAGSIPDDGGDFDGADYDIAVSQSAAAGPLARDLLVGELGAVVLTQNASSD